MGVGTSSERRASEGAAGLEDAVFQQRGPHMKGMGSARGVSVEDRHEDDFTDISYTEGGGIISPQDIPNTNSQYINHHHASTGPQQHSGIKKTSPHRFRNSFSSDEHNKENIVGSTNKRNSLGGYNTAGITSVSPASEFYSGSTFQTNNTHQNNAYPTITGSSYENSGSVRHRQRPHRTQSHDSRRTTTSDETQDDDGGGLVIERTTSEMSFIITPPPPEHPASPDLPQIVSDGGNSESTSPLPPTNNMEDMRLEEVT